MNTAEQIENAKAALGFHPDSDTNIADEISRIRDEGRGHFHTVTKQLDVIAELRRQIATYKEDQRVSSEAYNFLHAEYTKLHAAASAMGDILCWDKPLTIQARMEVLTQFESCMEPPKHEATHTTRPTRPD